MLGSYKRRKWSRRTTRRAASWPDGEVLVATAFGEQLLLSGVGERQMANVVQQPGEADDLAVVVDLLLLVQTRQGFADRVSQVTAVHERVEDLSGELHHTERVLEAAVGGPGVDQIGHGELMDLP